MALNDQPPKSPKSGGRQLGPTGDAVRHNIRRLRDEKGISAPKLSEALDKLGRPIPPLGIGRIESGERRVDVDDLMAFAAALEVSPATLLMPSANEPTDQVRVTAVSETTTAFRAWAWITAVMPVTKDVVFAKFVAFALPAFRQEGAQEAALRALPGVDRTLNEIIARVDPEAARAIAQELSEAPQRHP